jgi:hypothetical protein
MLWAFFDESGWHPTGGELVKLTVGGCIASFENWQALSLDWSDAIKRMDIDMFHMTDFEKTKPPIHPFDTWTAQQRKDRLNTLLGIIGTAKPFCCGFTNWTRPGESTASVYKRCTMDILLELGRYEDDFAIIFAHHPEFAAYSPLHEMLMEYGYAKGIKTCTIGYPIDLCPLQAADIVAYEIRCQEREDGRPMRYPMRRLQEMCGPFRISASVD